MPCATPARAKGQVNLEQTSSGKPRATRALRGGECRQLAAAPSVSRPLFSPMLATQTLDLNPYE